MSRGTVVGPAVVIRNFCESADVVVSYNILYFIYQKFNNNSIYDA